MPPGERDREGIEKPPPPARDQLESPARFLYVKLFAFAVDVPPSMPLSYPATQSIA